jgi:hypothetical protein
MSNGVLIPSTTGNGIENPHYNILPTCQLQHIQNLVNHLVDGSQTPWRIDIVCIPPRQEDYELRKLAIQRMRQTYSNAVKVLVLDADLMMMPKSTNPIEVYLRLKMSSRMRRLWNSQEAMLAETLFLQFTDGNLDRLCSKES